jgi:hypothetical protein
MECELLVAHGKLGRVPGADSVCCVCVG